MSNSKSLLRWFRRNRSIILFVMVILFILLLLLGYILGPDKTWRTGIG